MSDTKALHLYAAHHRQIVSYANSIVGNNEQAEDIAQDAYLRFQAAMQEEVRENPIAYLYRIVRNLALDCRRRTRLEKNIFVQDADDIVEALPADSPDIERQAMANAEFELLLAALAELPERTRTALEMHRLGGFKLREIAQHLGVSKSMAQFLVKEGIKHCQQYLSRALS